MSRSSISQVKRSFLPGKEDGNGVIAGTTNHIAPCDWTQLIIKDSEIVEINEGGAFGDKLRKLKEETADLQSQSVDLAWRGGRA